VFMPLDVTDYEKIAAMIREVREEIKMLRQEVVPTDVQTLVNATIDKELKLVQQRLGKIEAKMENAATTWIMRAGVIAALVLSLLEILAHVKISP